MSEILSADQLRHHHRFDEGNPLAERNTRWAVYLTLIMMVAEISGGIIYNSMALLADGWHMSSHALALGLSVMAYAAARKYARDPRFAFGTWKIEVLGGYTSALFLVAVAGLMLYESMSRLLSPSPIQYDQAIWIAALGLSVNLVCAWLLRDNHSHNHDHGHSHSPKHSHDQDKSHDHSHDKSHDKSHALDTAISHNHEAPKTRDSFDAHEDLNLRAAYIHVLTDAATSVLAIVALFGGKIWGADWLDPVMGIVGAALVSVWAYGLLKETGRVLLDANMDAPITEEVREVIKELNLKLEITDLHVWRVGRGKFSCIVALAAYESVTPEFIRQQLKVHEELVHVSVEVNHLSAESGLRA